MRNLSGIRRPFGDHGAKNQGALLPPDRPPVGAYPGSIPVPDSARLASDDLPKAVRVMSDIHHCVPGWDD